MVISLSIKAHYTLNLFCTAFNFFTLFYLNWMKRFKKHIERVLNYFTTAIQPCQEMQKPMKWAKYTIVMSQIHRALLIKVIADQPKTGFCNYL
jgi:hypothetical protein